MPLIGKFLVQQDSIGNNSVVASKIAANAITASILAPNEDPALNPNQPNQSKDVPKITNGMFAGLIFSESENSFLLLPRKKAPHNAVIPADI